MRSVEPTMRTGLPRALLLLGVLFLSLSCESRRPPSILVVAIDSLPFNPSVCSREITSRRSGLREMCAESIRFTHALTTSTLTVPAMTSLLTGLYPFQHGVRTNGRPGLAAERKTLAEIAVARGLRTALFSGGPPLFRRSGLHQGFEIFEDFFNPSANRVFRSLAENVTMFSSWLTADVSGKPFFAALYVPDLNFTDTPTETEVGEIRSFTYESQLDELDESLASLLDSLKTSRRWDDTLVVVVGLNGRENTVRPGMIEPLLLNSENTQVTLLIKPALKPRDQGMTWKIDRNVSIADVGRTLFSALGELPQGGSTEFPVYDLSSIFRSPEPAWPDSRPLLIESAWAAWQGWGGVRAALVEDHDLLLFDERPSHFNTLTDQFEQNPGRPSPQSSAARRWIGLLEKNGFSPFAPVAPGHLAPLRMAALDWLLPGRQSSWAKNLLRLSRSPGADSRTLAWAALAALETRNWPELERLANRTGDLSWKAIALRNQGRPAPFSDACLALFDAKEPETDALRACPDELFTALFQWARADLNRQGGETAKRHFLRLWEMHALQMKVLKANAGLGLLWFSAGEEPTLPSRTQLALALPELRRFRPPSTGL